MKKRRDFPPCTIPELQCFKLRESTLRSGNHFNQLRTQTLTLCLLTGILQLEEFAMRRSPKQTIKFQILQSTNFVRADYATRIADVPLFHGQKV